MNKNIKCIRSLDLCIRIIRLNNVNYTYIFINDLFKKAYQPSISFKISFAKLHTV